MKFHTKPLRLDLKVPFKISYGTSTMRENVLVFAEAGELTGVGEAAVVPYYYETPQRVMDYIENLVDEAWSIEELYLHLPPSESSAAQAGLDIALHDVWGKQQGKPLYELWGLNPENCPSNSYTIPMSDDKQAYRQMLEEKQDYPLLKLKLGSGSLEKDLEMVKLARTLTDSTLCVDANNAWTAEQSLSIIPHLLDLDVVFVEQPVAKADMDGWRILSQQLPKNRPLLIADESVQGVESVSALAGLVDGINIKLAKCGGLSAARNMIQQARQLGMKVMLGCMVETSVAITAMSHLAPLADFLDLDGNSLLKQDPYRGTLVDEATGQLTLPHTPGLGVSPRVE